MATDRAPCLAAVVPVFNEVGTVAKAITLVLAQPLVQEVVVVDDGSTDGTWSALEVLAKTDGRIKLFRHETNLGKARCSVGGHTRTGKHRVGGDTGCSRHFPWPELAC